MGNKKLRSNFYTVYLLLMSAISKYGGDVIFNMKYSNVIHNIIIGSAVIFSVVGIYQIIFAKIKIKFLEGRSLGFVILFTAVVCINFYNESSLSKRIEEVYNYNQLEIQECKDFYLKEDGLKFITSTDEERDAAYISIILHEYTHKLTCNLLDKYEIDRLSAPAWMYEGVAEYIRNKYLKIEIPAKFSNEIKELDVKNDYNFNGADAYLYYEKASIIMNSIINTYGDNILIDIIQQFKIDGDIYKAIEKVTGKSFEEIEKSLK